MFKFNPDRSWPPENDLTSLRAALAEIYAITRPVPHLGRVASALRSALREIDKAEAEKPKAMARNLLSSFRATRLKH